MHASPVRGGLFGTRASGLVTPRSLVSCSGLAKFLETKNGEDKTEAFNATQTPEKKLRVSMTDLQLIAELRHAGTDSGRKITIEAWLRFREFERDKNLRAAQIEAQTAALEYGKQQIDIAARAVNRRSGPHRSRWRLQYRQSSWRPRHFGLLGGLANRFTRQRSAVFQEFRDQDRRERPIEERRARSSTSRSVFAHNDYCESTLGPSGRSDGAAPTSSGWDRGQKSRFVSQAILPLVSRSEAFVVFAQ